MKTVQSATQSSDSLSSRLYHPMHESEVTKLTGWKACLTIDDEIATESDWARNFAKGRVYLENFLSRFFFFDGLFVNFDSCGHCAEVRRGEVWNDLQKLFVFTRPTFDDVSAAAILHRETRLDENTRFDVDYRSSFTRSPNTL